MQLFRKRMTKACAYCAHGTALDEDQILCPKKGVMSVTAKCRKFIYDPCKRVPVKKKPVDFQQYNETDFSL